MLDEWLKFWRQWTFWWLPNGDKPEDGKAEQQEPQRHAAPAKSDKEAPDVDATNT